MVAQSSFMLTTGQPIRLGYIESLVELSVRRIAIIGIFALDVGMMDEQTETRPEAASGLCASVQNPPTCTLWAGRSLGNFRSNVKALSLRQGASQFSILSPGTFLNSRTFPVTNIPFSVMTVDATR
jgi:hypothetical protein